MENKKGLTKLLLFTLLVIVIVTLNGCFGWSKYLSNMDNLSFLQEIVNNNFLVAIFIYIVLTIVGCVVFALPGITFAVIAGVLFGPVIGIFACLVATTLGAMLAFLTARFFLRDTIKPMLEKNSVLKKLLFLEDGKSDMLVLMITRMVPIFPYNLQNFAYGITDISFWKYSIFTFIFMLPGVSFFTIGAAGLTAGEEKWRYFLIAGILAFVVTGTGILIQRKFLKADKEEL
ncbi:TVP38/TMEM64 family protein [Clostridium sp. Marseille-P299]|uniref:TVP38/TMEM64 family protein n=1 Tax=Clostridium sp. Marseille-P299 TaxID=1805477 RepID=UPI000831D59F|nr:VTT domain-containing protein [Clostridium sp. Marseille-P299]